MPGETSTTVFYVAIVLINSFLAAFTAYYYLRRLRLEERKLMVEEHQLNIQRNGP
jgi:protein-S-isoprenylcysteine O-methyltransferase Ste14